MPRYKLQSQQYKIYERLDSYNYVEYYYNSCHSFSSSIVCYSNNLTYLSRIVAINSYFFAISASFIRGQNGYLELINQIDHQPIKIQEQIIAAISSLVRGESLYNKRRFIDLNGIPKLLSNLSSNRCCEKVVNLLRDLLYYDEKLHQTYHDVSKFSNTTGGLLNKQEQYSLTKDINDDLQKNNELPENQKYKGIVKNMLFQNKFLSFLDTFLADTSYKNSDDRAQFLHCAEILYQIHPDKQFGEKVRQHFIQIIKQEDKNEAEMQFCKQFN